MMSVRTSKKYEIKFTHTLESFLEEWKKFD